MHLKNQKISANILVIFSTICIVSSCGEQTLEDTRKLPNEALTQGKKVEAGQTATNGITPTGATSSGSNTEQGSAIVIESNQQSNSVRGTPEPSKGDIQSSEVIDPLSTPAVPDPTSTPTPRPTPQTVYWEPANIFQNVKKNCMTGCHTHSDFENKNYFLSTKERSLIRMRLTKSDFNPGPMPPPARAPNFDRSAEETELLNWLQSQ